jgi:uncharacterized protein YndB with AHSA1/START domain
MDKLGNISNEAVERASGRTWEEWISILNDRGAYELTHKQIAAMLGESGLVDDPWWAQMVTVGYEYAIERRTVGRTAEAGFQVGVQRTLPIDAETLWNVLATADGQRMWLGDVKDAVPFEKGVRYETLDGISGEIRSVAMGTRLRLTWRRLQDAEPTTLQFYITPKQSRSALQFHHEKLRDAGHREEMKVHWQEVLKALAEIVG